MMIFGKKSTIGPIGVDLGLRCAKVAQIRETRSGQKLAAAAVIPVSDPQKRWSGDAVREFRNVLSRHGFEGSQVVLAMPGEKLLTEVLDLPPRDSGAPIDQIARAEIARTARLTDDAFEFSCWDLPAPARATNSTAVMAVAARHIDTEELLSSFHEEGMEVVAIDAQAWALSRVCTRLSTADGIVGILDLSWMRPQIILSHAGKPLYYRSIDGVSLGEIHQNLMKDLQVPDAEAEYLLMNCKPSAQESDVDTTRMWKMVEDYLDLVSVQARAALTYAAHRYASLPVDQMFLTGGGAAINGAAAFMQERLQLDTSVMDVYAALSPSDEVRQRFSGCMMATAVGLALRGAA